MHRAEIVAAVGVEELVLPARVGHRLADAADVAGHQRPVRLRGKQFLHQRFAAELRIGREVGDIEHRPLAQPRRPAEVLGIAEQRGQRLDARLGLNRIRRRVGLRIVSPPQRAEDAVLGRGGRGELQDLGNLLG